MDQPNSIEARDISYHLHSYTNARKHQNVGPLIVERGQGIYVEDLHGKKYIEALAGLWCVAVGFGERRLIEAASRQMAKLPYYHNFSHKSHGPVIELAEKLISMAPAPMSKAFFTNSGSEANDTALKLIWYRSNALGQHHRKKVISRVRAYHGVTVASASLTGLPNNHRSFDLPIPNILHTSCPHHWREARFGESEEDFASRLAEDLETLILREGPETIAAFFGEPIMGAGGVIIPPRTYWAKIQAVLRKYDILLVADEVITGFGRIGNMFGCETLGIKPDMLVLSKQMASSYMPIAALLINERVFEPIADESNRIGVLGHGFTGSGHPVAAAVALENIKIIEERNLVEHARVVGERMQSGLRHFADHPLMGEVRGMGLIAAIELVTDKERKAGPEPAGSLGAAVSTTLETNGVICRPIRNSLAFCPPLIIEESEVNDLLGRIGRALDETQRVIRTA